MTGQHTGAGGNGSRVDGIVYSAVDLAHFAGVEELAAGAAVDGEEGEHLRACLLADEMAASHRLMMRLAARSDFAMQNAISFGGRDALPFDAAAARLGGMAARLSDHYRRGLLTLRRFGGREAPRIWHGYTWEGEPRISVEEAQRRIARMKAARAANEPPPPPPLSEADQAAVDAATDASRRLAADALVANFTDDDANVSGERLFVDQLAAGHRLMMRLSGRADWEIDRIMEPDADPLQTRHVALRLAGAAARLMERYRQGLLALERLSKGPDGGPGGSAGMFWAGPLPEGEREREIAEDAAAAAAGGASGAPPLDSSLPRGNLPPQSAPSSTPPAHGACAPKVSAENPNGAAARRRGRLRHGNPSGDFLVAPRCGACTRAGHACRQPAMPNGRCRLHGGKSTGPRTADGLARSRAARLTHGLRSAEIIDLRAAAVASSRRLRAPPVRRPARWTWGPSSRFSFSAGRQARQRCRGHGAGTESRLCRPI